MNHPNGQRCVVLGTTADPHVARVISRFRQLGLQAIVLDYLACSKVTALFDDKLLPSILIDAQEIRESDLLWSRLKMIPGGPFYFNDQVSGESAAERNRRHSLQEQNWLALYDVVLACHGGRTINNIPKFHRSLAKPAQQMIAARCGMKFPPTILSNVKEDLVDFAKHHEFLITKPAATTRLPIDGKLYREPLMTYDVTLEEIESSTEACFLSAPLMLQKKVPKLYELRVVCTSSAYRAFSINSAEHAGADTDWRRATFALKFEPVKLSDDTVRCAQQFLAATSRDYGSFDFIVDRDGVHWFLECNPDGQWGWLEDAREPDISNMLADSFQRLV